MEAGMNRDLLWLTDEQFEKIAAHLPKDTLGKPRVHILKSGSRWTDYCAASRPHP
jgi:hypothetical protein